MGYCVSGCLDFDEVTGNLTVKQDPLGGIECLSSGQRIRIAGNTRGVAVSNVNNGLFMTTAGELATKVTPQLKSLQTVEMTTTINAAQSASTTSGVLGGTSSITMANPSPVYPMLVIANYQFSYDFSITGTGSMRIKGDVGVNSVFTEVSTYHEIGGSGVSARYGNKVDRLRIISVPAATSYTLQASQHWTTGGGGATYYLYSAYTLIEAYGLIIQGVS